MDGEQVYFFQMDYGKANFREPETVGFLLALGAIKKVELVYTQYPVSASKKLDALNQRRMDALFTIVPTLATNDSVAWSLIAQSDCRDAGAAKQMLHGFAITVETPKWSELAEADVNYIKDLINSPDTLEEDHPSKEIMAILNRHEDWNKMLIVQDVTGSMYPYTAGVLLWHKLNAGKTLIHDYVFFNDGNLKPEDKKRIGRTGGVFHASGAQLDRAMETCFHAMREGHGGLAPENNLEALLKGTKNCHGYEEVVMIADNLATPSDMSLLPRLKVPVRIILCGVGEGGIVNPAYLEIAYATGGSVHTLEGDLERLVDLNEGETFEFGGVEYRVEGGKFMVESGISL